MDKLPVELEPHQIYKIFSPVLCEYAEAKTLSQKYGYVSLYEFELAVGKYLLAKFLSVPLSNIESINGAYACNGVMYYICYNSHHTSMTHFNKLCVKAVRELT